MFSWVNKFVENSFIIIDDDYYYDGDECADKFGELMFVFDNYVWNVYKNILVNTLAHISDAIICLKYCTCTILYNYANLQLSTW